MWPTRWDPRYKFTPVTPAAFSAPRAILSPSSGTERWSVLASSSKFPRGRIVPATWAPSRSPVELRLPHLRSKPHQRTNAPTEEQGWQIDLATWWRPI